MIKSEKMKKDKKASAKQASVKKSVSFDPENYNGVVDAANNGGIRFSTALNQILRGMKKR